MNVRERIAAGRIFSAAVLQRPDYAVPAARALLAGGIDVMEVTFRNEHAAECVRRIRAEVPDMMVGAGTLLEVRHLAAAQEAGAQFGVSPGFNPTVVRAAGELGLPFIPGALTPGEMEQAVELHCPWVKVFPASSFGPGFLRALSGPYGHTALRLIPLGGVDESNLKEYLSIPLVVAVAGSWLSEAALLSAGHWHEVTARAQRAVAVVRSMPSAR